MDTQAVADQIIDFARQEEAMMGPKGANASTWRAAAKALHEIGLRGPCLAGDQEFLSRLPVKHLAHAAKEDKGRVIIERLQKPIVVACDLNMRMKVFDNDAESTWAMDASDVIGTYPWDWLPSLRETDGEARIKAAFQGEIITTQGPFVSSSGVYGHRKVRTAPWHDVDGNIAGCLATLRIVGPVRRAA